MPSKAKPGTLNLRAKILDFRGFDSSNVFISRGGKGTGIMSLESGERGLIFSCP